MELAATNSKLLRKVEALKGELNSATIAYEKLRAKYAIDDSTIENDALKRRLLQTERELRSLRLSKGLPVATTRISLQSSYAQNTHYRETPRSRSVTPSKSTVNSRRSSASPYSSTARNQQTLHRSDFDRYAHFF